MRKQKLLSLWLVVALVVTLLPAGWGQGQTASAAPGAATYFIPDNTTLRNTALRSMDDVPAGSIITRDNVYSTQNGTLSITGSFSHVTADSMKVTIEALNQQGSVWVPDQNRFTTGVVLQDPQTSNKFIANNLTLFPGFNKITFSGLQSGIERSDTFYVLYDRVPYILNMSVISGNTQINLNEGTQVVVPGATATLQGRVANATRVTVSVNDGTAVLGSLLEDGTFFSPSLSLKPGLNTMKITVSNASDSMSVIRQVYYFDTTRPFTQVELVHVENGNPVNYNILNNIPKVTIGSTTVPGETGQVKAQLLVPYDSAPFGDNASYILNGAASQTIASGDVSQDTIVPGPDGITPQYRLVTFLTPTSFDFAVYNGNYTTAQPVNLIVTYGTYTTAFNGSFQYLPGETIITNMYYLPDYDGTADVTDVPKEPLNGAQVSSGTFYILVESDKDPDVATLSGAYLPLSTTNLNLTQVGTATGLTPNQRVYQVTGFSSGQQKVAFRYSGGSTTYNADITFVSKSYIYVASLYDGQTYEYDSRLSNLLTITGEYIGFQSLSSPKYFINGIEPSGPGAGEDYTLDVVAGTPPTQTQFSLTLGIGDGKPLVFGENRILFTGFDQDSAGNIREIRKEIRIYLIDTNISTVNRFHPTLVPTIGAREPFTSADLTTYSTTQMANIFALTPEFLLQDGAYKTSEKSYDLVLRGSGASTLNLKLGSQLFFTKSIPVQNAPVLEVSQTYTSPLDGVVYTYDFAGDERDFILRIRNIPFAQPGTHVYNLELVNGTGARTNQRLEITREVSAYRILSPLPTVGNQITVNKNFIRFDIEAEGATEVRINGEPAVKRPDMNDRFVLDYVGLRPDRMNKINIEIIRQDAKLNDTVNVYYSSTVQVDSQYMEAIKTKHSVFNKALELSFPRGTVLKAARTNSLGITKLYNDTKLLFGIVDPKDGVLERRNDYGNIINVNNDDRSYGAATPIIIPDYLVQRFNNTLNTGNFTRVSDIYWISGGVGELGDKGAVGYKPATNGLPPYSIEGRFTEFEPERKVIPSNRGTLTLKFNESVVDEVAYTITVFRYSDNGEWENIGGEVDSRNNTITVPFDEFGYYMVGKLRKGYNDITNHNWARNILNALYSKGIMKNMRFDEFGADDQTTRGEFATLLVKGLNIKLNYDDNQTFFDVVPGAASATWDYEHIETAARSGIVTGLSEGFFGPDLRITRQEAAVMIARALELKLPTNDSKLEANLAKAFLDSGSIQYYARPAVDAVQRAKIMTGSPVTVPGQNKPGYNFNPRSNMTRAEAAKVTVELLKLRTKLFPKNLS